MPASELVSSICASQKVDACCRHQFLGIEGMEGMEGMEEMRGLDNLRKAMAEIERKWAEPACPAEIEIERKWAEPACPSATPAEVDAAPCCNCGQMVAVSDAVRLHSKRVNAKAPTFRCRPCNRLQSRISRMKQGIDMEVSFPSAAAKEAFYRKHQDAFGADLQAAMELVTSEVRSTTSSDRLAEEGHWLDEDDLCDKYKGKPDQLKNLLQNAKRMEHPTRKVTLYLDSNFKSTIAEKLAKSWLQRCGVHFKKAAPKPKDKAKAKADRLAKKAKRPSKKQMDALGVAVDMAQALVDKMATLSAKTAENSDFVPKRPFETLEIQRAHLKAVVAKACLALETTGWSGNPAALASELTKCSKALHTTAKPLQGLLKMAGGAVASGACWLC